MNRYLSLIIKICSLLSLTSLLPLAWSPVKLVDHAYAADVLDNPNKDNRYTIQSPSFTYDINEGLTVSQPNAESILLELITPQFQVEQIVRDHMTCQILHVDGYGQSEIPGQPSLPVIGKLIGIPPETEPILQVLNMNALTATGRFDLCPVSSPMVEKNFASEPKFVGETYQRDPQAYSMNAFLPEQVVELVSTSFLRSQRIAYVRFQPFQYNPVTGELRYYQSIRIQLQFPHGAKKPLSVQPTKMEGAFEGILRDILVNYDTAIQWRLESEINDLAVNDQDVDFQDSYKLLVNHDGIHQISYNDLQEAGIPVDTLDPRTLRLTNQGQEIAIQVAGEDDGIFNSTDYILFYGQKVDTKYTDTTVYYLSFGGDLGQRMTSVDGSVDGGDYFESFQSVVRLENNLLYLSNYASGPDQDRWYWDSINLTVEPKSKDFQASLQHVTQSPSLYATIRGLIKGYTAYPRQHTKIYLNGFLIEDSTWSAGGDHMFSIDVPQSYLVEGTNTIKVECSSEGGVSSAIILINWLEIEYWRDFTAGSEQLVFTGQEPGKQIYRIGGFTDQNINVFDISDPKAPIQILNFVQDRNLLPMEENDHYILEFEQVDQAEHQYIALTNTQYLRPVNMIWNEPSDLHSNSNKADYLIITHSDFYTAVLTLAEWRARQGLHTMVVKVDDIYDEFNSGIMDPSAIRDFLEYTYTNWQKPAPQFVLLAGDGNFDPRNFLGTGEPNYIPPLLAVVDLYKGETASDNRFVTIAGEDNLPDMFIGRFPIKTSTEATAVVNKIIGYEQNRVLSEWTSNTLFITDNPDLAGNFYAYSDFIVDGFLPDDYSAKKVYYLQTHSNITEARTAILEQINNGQFLVNYVGHGSIQSLATEKLLSRDSILSMNNAGRLPFVALFTCLAGSFHYPSPPTNNNSSLSEELLRAPENGAVAVWASTGMGLASGQDYLNRGLFDAIFTQNETRIGAAVVKAKLYNAQIASLYSDLMDTFTLIGDPALQLNIFQNTTYLPMVVR